MVKYRQRGGWTHRDVLRLCKPSNVPTPHHHVFAWATGNPVDYNRYDYMKIIAAYCHAQFPLLSDEAIATIIRDHNLPREAVPDDRLKSAVVWRALLHAGGGMPMTALIRNLNRMTAAGVFAGARDLGGRPCVSPPQVYLDLLHLPERAKEAAEQLRSDKLRWATHA